MPAGIAESIGLATTATLATCSASVVGALGAWWPKPIAPRVGAGLLGVAAGVMLAASLLSLLPQARQYAGPGVGGMAMVLGGFAAGVGLICLLDLVVPHQHPGASAPDHTLAQALPAVGGSSAATAPRAGISLLIAVALLLHNIPEGMAVGVAAVAEGQASTPMTWAIAAHNVIEGLLVTLPMRMAGFSAMASFAVGVVAGVTELIAGIAGALALGIAEPVLPFALAMAGGAMVFVTFEEVLPEALRLHQGNVVGLGATSGAVLALGLGL